ncbi:RNA polymerase sigma factor [Paraflavitalea speifideaquila]|uniref:RNA polymerase sigma factor n=1 Tax=Paraflavitalea speifideaquila TaxID=3076558 RepID=UPI0028F15407|nr:sigma factor [Paraflavitalea speifideiaquila]
MINRIQRNPEAYRELIVNYQQLVTMIVSGLIPCPDNRADIIQDVFLKVYEHLPVFRFESKLSTWIGRIAYNTCLAFLRKRNISCWTIL